MTMRAWNATVIATGEAPQFFEQLELNFIHILHRVEIENQAHSTRVFEKLVSIHRRRYVGP